MKRLIAIASGLLVAAGLAASTAIAQQPSIDLVDIDEKKCYVTVEWIDGTEIAETIEVFVNSVRTHNIVLNDVVGNQSRVVAYFSANAGDGILARITTTETSREARLRVGDCPVATATPVPPTATPIPPTPIPPTPIVIQPPTVEITVVVPPPVIQQLPVLPPVIQQLPVIQQPPVIQQLPAQPVVIQQQPARVIEVERVVTSRITVPSTGDGGLVK